MINLWTCFMIFNFLHNQPNALSAPRDEFAKCKIDATVRDYSALDGCRFLLELKDGTRLLPVELSEPDFLFSEGQLVKINYSEAKGAMTTCMTGSLAVKVECIQQIQPGEKPGQVFFKKECFDTQAPLSIAWINKAVIRNKVSEVKKGYLDNNPQYILYGNATVMLFTCTGELVCEYPANSATSCTAQIESLKELRSIWTQK